MESPYPPQSGDASSDLSRDSRRGFLRKSATVALGAATYAVPTVGGALVMLDPLQRRSATDQLVRLASLDSLPEDGSPIKVPVIAERIDAWTRSVQAIGAVYLRRTEGDQVQALQVICPHAGCSVEYKGSAEAAFVCPCHKTRFNIAGERLSENSQSPRDMDRLDTEIRGGDVWVRFQVFQTGTPDRVPAT